MKQYTHLSEKEREKLFLLRRDGMSYRKIAKEMQRSHSTLVRECNRNTKSAEMGYLYDTANM